MTMLLKPLITYTQSNGTLDLYQQFKESSNKKQSSFEAHKQRNIFIGFVQAKKEQIESVFDIRFQNTDKNVLVWVSQQDFDFPNIIQEQRKQLSNLKGKLLYFSHSSYHTFLKHQDKDKIQQFLARLIMNMSQFLIFDVNSKYMKTFNNQSPKVINTIKNFLMLNQSIGEVYMADTQSTVNKIQLANKITKDNLLNQMKLMMHQYFEKNQNKEQEISSFMMNLSEYQKLINQTLFNFGSFRSLTNSQPVWLTFIINKKLKEFLKKDQNQYISLIEKQKCLSYDQFKKLEKQIKQFLLQTFCKLNDKFIPICNKIQKNLLKQLNKINDDLKLTFVKKIKIEKIDNLQTYFDIYKVKEKLVGIFNQYSIDQFLLNCICSDGEKRLSAKQMVRINQTLIQNNSQKSLLQFQIKQKNKTIDQYQKQIQTLQTNLYSYQNLNQQFRLCHDDMQRQKNKNKVLQLQVKALQVQLNKKIQSEKYLEKFINRLMDQKSQFTLQVSSLKLKNQNLQEQNQKQVQQIKIFNQKIIELNKLEDWAKQAIQNSKFIQQQANGLKNWTKNIEQNIKSFKICQANKINVMLKKNYQKYVILQNKNRHLIQYIQKLQDEKSKMQIKIQTQKNKSLYFQKQVLRIMDGSKQKIIKQENAELQVTDRDLAITINKINNVYDYGYGNNNGNGNGDGYKYGFCEKVS